MALRFLLAASLLVSGCSVSKVARPTPADTLRATDESARLSAERSLRRYLGPSRRIQLGDEQLSTDGSYDFASYYVQYELTTGWEGVYHTRLIFVKKKVDPDWSESRIFNDPGPYMYAPAYSGSLRALEEQGQAFGREVKK